MGNGFLPREVANLGTSLSIVADGDPIMKPGGMTVDWSTVAAVSGSDVTWLENFLVKVGEKALRYGQLMCEITGGEITTLTITAESGNVTVTVGGQVATFAYNADAAAIDAALEALSTVGAGKVVVSGTGPFTLTFDPSLGDVAVSASGATVATTSVGGRNGKFGPFDPAAVDGRQTPVRGKCFWVMSSVRESDRKSDYVPGLEGGRVFLERLIQAGAGTASLAAGPQLATVNTLFPDLRYA